MPKRTHRPHPQRRTIRSVRQHSLSFSSNRRLRIRRPGVRIPPSALHGSGLLEPSSRPDSAFPGLHCPGSPQRWSAGASTDAERSRRVARLPRLPVCRLRARLGRRREGLADPAPSPRGHGAVASIEHPAACAATSCSGDDTPLNMVKKRHVTFAAWQHQWGRGLVDSRPASACQALGSMSGRRQRRSVRGRRGDGVHGLWARKRKQCEVLRPVRLTACEGLSGLRAHS